MDLFVGSMLTLVLAGDLLLLYLGWEGVGLCSYLLIGFWYVDPANGRAARKAFIVTRIGDAAMAAGLLLLFTNLGTSEIQALMQRASQQWGAGSGFAVAAAALLLGGALGKSAQLPLQTWLPDAMAGPTPVSALIHAATMVTAGVYLIARAHVLFALAPPVQMAVAVIGAVTLLYAGFAALAQSDIKRVLAYSTISQIGYMFLALGVGAWSAAIFHLMTHAFFKSLLFLGAGVVILGLNREHNMFKMGGLRKELPGTFLTFLIAAASLSALPLVTAGFYSKDAILSSAWTSGAGSRWLWAAGLAGALLTSVYSFRMVFLTFFGELRQKPRLKPGICMVVPLATLSVLCIVGGSVQVPETLGNVRVFSDFLNVVLPPAAAHETAGTEAALQVVAGVASVLGVLVAYYLFLHRPQHVERWTATLAGARLHRLWLAGWGFDWAYDRLFVRPLVWAARANKADFIDSFSRAMAQLNVAAHAALRRTQTGHVRWYAMVIVMGGVIAIWILVL
jgi:NADH-quinone oxidoreductase subunit L